MSSLPSGLLSSEQNPWSWTVAPPNIDVTWPSQVIEEFRAASTQALLIDLEALQDCESSVDSLNLFLRNSIAKDAFHARPLALVTPNDLVYGMLRMAEGRADINFPLGLFRTKEKAEIWLRQELECDLAEHS